MIEPFQHVDELGPGKVLEIAEQRTGLRAIVVIDNVACGPAIGGVRMATDGSVRECARLARAMTLKNSAAGLPHGGGKSVVLADPRAPEDEKEGLLRAFAVAIRDLCDYIPGPDMGTNERSMAWVHDEIGRAVGLPAEIGGIPLDEIGSTGLGVALAAEAAAEHAGFPLAGARVAVQGFGAVGSHAAHFLVERGAVLVAAADSRGALADPAGLDVDALIAHKRAGGEVAALGAGRALERDAILDVECELWIPAARPDVLNEATAGRIRARAVVQGANIPATPDAERLLHGRGVLVVPDIIANSGGVITAAVEYRGGSREQALAAIEQTVGANVRRLLQELRGSERLPREVALAMARARVRRAMEARRWN